MCEDPQHSQACGHVADGEEAVHMAPGEHSFKVVHCCDESVPGSKEATSCDMRSNISYISGA